MSMLNKIVKTLKLNSLIKDYKIVEVLTKTTEQFFDLEKLETTRETCTNEAEVTIYLENLVNNVKKIFSSSFIVSHKISTKELNKLIDDAIYASKFAGNEYYELVKADKKLSFKQKKEEKEPFELLQDIANVFFSSSNEECKFNALELFYEEKNIRLVNSRGVDYKKQVHKIMCEAIPSYNKNNIKTELYRMFTYDTVDMNKIKEDSINALNDVKLRALAKNNTFKGKINLILKDDKLKSLFEELISTYSYADVYKKSNYKSIGEMVQTNPVTPLTLSLIPKSKGDFFDSDGVLLKPVTIIENGKLIDYYGSNRFAYYLKKKPNGNYTNMYVNPSNVKEKDLRKERYIEVVDLSGIQVDLFGNYIGGEIRLATYFDGKDTYPISGLSFSGNLKESMDTMVLSKEKTKINGYSGAKYMLLKDIEIM